MRRTRKLHMKKNVFSDPDIAQGIFDHFEELAGRSYSQFEEALERGMEFHGKLETYRSIQLTIDSAFVQECSAHCHIRKVIGHYAEPYLTAQADAARFSFSY